MKSAVFQGTGRLHTIEDVPVPEPGLHQVLIEVGRCGICGSDVSGGNTRSPSEVAARLLRDPDCPLTKLVPQTATPEHFPEVFLALGHGAPHSKALVAAGT